MNDSPWSKTVEIERKLGLKAPAGAPKLAGAPGVTEENECEEEDDDDREGEKEGKKDDAKFRVRCVSSRTLREAAVRVQVLQGKILVAWIAGKRETESLAIDKAIFGMVSKSSGRNEQ